MASDWQFGALRVCHSGIQHGNLCFRQGQSGDRPEGISKRVGKVLSIHRRASGILARREGRFCNRKTLTLTPVQIGITGGIGSGKSLICKIFQVFGVPVHDADSRAKDLMTTDGILVSAIKKEFGELSYQRDGSLNRQYLSETVFKDEVRLNVLNQLVHPRVGDDYARWVSEHRGHAYVLKEAALFV